MLFLTLTGQAKHESLPYDRVLREIGLDIKNSSNCKPLSYSRERERPFTHFFSICFSPSAQVMNIFGEEHQGQVSIGLTSHHL